MNLSIDLIEGIINPSNQCAYETTYSPRSALSARKEYYPLDTVITIFENFEDNFDKKDSDFWKLRTINLMLISPSIVSMTFYPTKQSTNQWIFLQKINLVEERIGFFAPYMSEKELKEWNAIDKIPTLSPSLKIENEGLEKDLLEIYSCFQKDSESKGLCLSFLDQNNTPFSIGWIKPI